MSVIIFPPLPTIAPTCSSGMVKFKVVGDDPPEIPGTPPTEVVCIGITDGIRPYFEKVKFSITQMQRNFHYIAHFYTYIATQSTQPTFIR